MGPTKAKRLFFRWPVLLMLLFSTSGFLYGQIEVSGIITDSQSGETLPGVNVLIKGDASGTITDFDGSYTITADPNDTLLVSYTGYGTTEVPIAGQTSLDIEISFTSQRLSEVVVIGYTSQQRSKVTGAVASVDIENLEKRVTPDVTQSLQGNVTGVQINYTDGSPGAGVNFNIRGISSPFGQSNPLVIVDGVQLQGLQFRAGENVQGEAGIVQSTGLENLDPNDIESIQILKDAAAAAIYGNRAANGVVLVTTKKGKKGRVNLDYNGNVGVSTPYAGPDLANSQEYIQILQSMYGDDLSQGDLIPQAALDYLANPSQFDDYDWYDQVFDPAFQTSHNLAVSGSGDFGNYRVSAGYRNQDGIALGTAYERFNVRGSGDFNVGKRLKFGQTIGLSTSNTDSEPYAFSRSVYYNAIVMYPYFSPFGVNPDPANVGDRPRNSSFYWGGGDNPEALIRNPLDYNEFWSQDIGINNLQLSTYGQLEIVKGLSYKLTGTYNLSQIRLRTRTRTFSQPEEYFDLERSIDESENQESNWTLENTLTYNRVFNRHSINALVGFVAQQFDTRGLGGFKGDFLSDLTSTLDGPGANPNFTELFGSETRSRLNSIISQISYSFDSRYLVTVNFRRDGTSSFVPDERWGNFPGFSLGWRISQEPFWQNSPGLSRVISELKIRGGYGVLGRISSGTYPPQAILQFVGYTFNGAAANGLITPGPINPFISWEESQSTNIGFDFGLFNNKITGYFDWFNRTTDQLLSAILIPPSAGGGEVSTNDGEIQNEGVEFEIGYNDSWGDFSLNVNLNMTYIKTTMTRVPEPLIIGGEPEFDVPHVQQTRQGRSPAEFWLIPTDGIFRTQEEVDNYVNADGEPIQPNAQPGDVRFVDVNGDGEITDEAQGGDRVFSGQALPKWSGGLNITMDYRGVDFTVSMFGAFGHHIFNGPQYLIEQPYGFSNFSTNMVNAFDPVSNPNSSFPRNNPRDLEENWNSRPTSDRYLEKGDFVKFPLIQIGYTLPDATMERFGINRLRFYFTMQNPFVITGYSGIDPEQGRDGFFSAGIDRGTVPMSRSFLFGVNLGL